MKRKNYLLAALASLLCFSTLHGAEKPVVTKITDQSHGASIEGLSDNGKWAVGYGKSKIYEQGYSFPILYDVENKKLTRLYTEQQGETIARMMAFDVTDDGSIVAGMFDGKPALYYQATGEWKMLPFDSKNWTAGECSHITPDGKYAIGTLEKQERVKATIAYWDLTGPEPVEVPLNLPKPISLDGQLNSVYQQIYASDLATDGQGFTGLVMFSFSGESWNFIYSMATNTWMALGYDITEVDDTHYNFTPKRYDGYSVRGGSFLHGTPYLVGTTSSGGGQYTYYLNPKDFSFKFEPGAKYSGIFDLNGTQYGSEEIAFTARNFIFKVGNYWYDFRDFCKQIWDLDWQADVTKDEYGYSGTLCCVSDDGLTIVTNDYASAPYDTFIIELPEKLCDAAPRFDLLAHYTVTPPENSSFGTLKEVKIEFDRSLQLNAGYNGASLLDESGTVVANSIGITLDTDDATIMTITFRNRRLEEGKKYTLFVPAGTVAVRGDEERTNSEIRVSYTGRPSAPVKATNIVPASGSKISKINANSNPISITFDTNIAAVTAPNAGRMLLYRVNDDDNREQIAVLSGSITGNTINVYPVIEQLLGRGDRYEVVIEANVLADISGADANEEIVIRYEGTYLPAPDFGDMVFFDNFDSGLSSADWMIFDGDGQEPSTEPAGWGFNELLPWWLARDDNSSTDMAAVSHSMYTTPQKSDDWLVTRRLSINDETCQLSFKAQSYRKAKNDKIKVYVYPTESVITALTQSIVDHIRIDGDLVVDATLTPGAKEEIMAGDWEEFNIKLDKYAGQNVYIAFLNDNYNQSAVFVDDVKVRRDVKVSFVNLTPSTALRAEEIEVKGMISVESKTDSYKGYTITLKDANGNEVSTISDPDAEMDEGYERKFTFPNKFNTPIGKETAYSISIVAGDAGFGEYKVNVENSVKNLAYQTEKKVVLEKYTGQTCANCPLGIAALEWIEQDFPGKVIPIGIHTYSGDNFATPKAAQLQQALGFTAAPSARIDRLGISSPMDISDKGDYSYMNSNLWYDYVVAELNELPEADIEITKVDFDGSEYIVSLNVKYALDMEDQNVNILTVVCEDELKGTQENNRSNMEHPALREWGKGGKYGEEKVSYTYHDVLRTWEGNTFNGTGGLIPANVEGGKVYEASVKIPNVSFIKDNNNTTVTALLIDAETGFVINADRKKIYYEGSGVENANADRPEIGIHRGIIYATTEGEIAISAYSLDGKMIANAAGADAVSLNMSGYSGVAVVLVKTSEGVYSYKVMI